MGLLNYIRGIKEKAVKESKEDYIPVEKLNTSVQVYETKTSLKDKVSGLASSVRVATKEAALKTRENVEKVKVWKKTRAEQQRANLKQKIEDTKLKVELQKQQAKLKPTGLQALAGNLKKLEKPVAATKKKPQRLASEPLNPSGNVFGGRDPFG